MSAQQLDYYINNIKDDVYLSGLYILVCDYYLYYGVEILGSDIIDAIVYLEKYDFEATIEYINEFYFGEDGYRALPDGSHIRPEYFALPLASNDSHIVYDDSDEEITYE